ncbi:MAG: tRNA glutamyl-Q(34) synthetase GluQRS [Desulfovibrio desulfuricans]|jgi:glutamyl-tRNA synthetase|nr:tRNA glutamyl-Q(34) synthetase GluQRS [Desulfovibrio desulfuricans]
MPAARPVRGRLAPSPTGYLHLGNAWAFLLAWLAARAQDGEVLLRIEDIDPQRSRPEYTAAVLEDLNWLGLDWDFGPGAKDVADAAASVGPYEQSCRGALYAEALARLEQAGLTYPCFCTRKELRSLAAAPHVDDVGAPYPGTCRHLTPAQREAFLARGRRPCVRLRCPEDAVRFTDAVQGPQCLTLADCGGDFALRRSDGVVAYQLAVAVDDALMGITQVVRGRDILPSTPRQIVLLRLLGHAVPQYAHVPLLLDQEGQRLAKRHAALSLRSLRQAGAAARDIIGLLGLLANANPGGGPAAPSELLPGFALSRVPGGDIRLTSELLRAHGLEA